MPTTAISTQFTIKSLARNRALNRNRVEQRVDNEKRQKPHSDEKINHKKSTMLVVHKQCSPALTSLPKTWRNLLERTKRDIYDTFQKIKKVGADEGAFFEFWDFFFISFFASNRHNDDDDDGRMS
jgi:hypothetical protein